MLVAKKSATVFPVSCEFTERERVGRVNPAIAARPNIKSADQPLADYYRCDVPPLRSHAADHSISTPGYFRLGKDSICYGHLANGRVAKEPVGDLRDALEEVAFGADSCELPFDPHEIIENLLRERYAAHFREEGSFLNEILRRIYYAIRPFMGVSTRVHLQRAHLRGWRDIKFPAWPVDTTVDQIYQKLLWLSLKAQRRDRVPFIWFWPDGYSSAAILTHDVEAPLGKSFCPALMDLDEAAGFRSSFQIVPENRYKVTQAFLNSITSRGFEVNVHDLKHDGRLYAEHKEFLRRAQCINRYVEEFGAQGFRSGILYRNADWYEAFEFSYDMSIPNVGHLDPQRGGCCTVMPYFIGNIVELPVTCTQDYTLFQILGDYSIDLWKTQIQAVQDNYGLISFIVHPDYIVESKPQATYKQLLSHLVELQSQGSVWSALPRDVAEWWRQRSQMTLCRCGNGWEIEGAGSERAKVAYAYLDGDSLRYSISTEKAIDCPGSC